MLRFIVFDKYFRCIYTKKIFLSIHDDIRESNCLPSFTSNIPAITLGSVRFNSVTFVLRAMFARNRKRFRLSYSLEIGVPNVKHFLPLQAIIWRNQRYFDGRLIQQIILVVWSIGSSWKTDLGYQLGYSKLIPHQSGELIRLAYPRSFLSLWLKSEARRGIVFLPRRRGPGRSNIIHLFRLDILSQTIIWKIEIQAKGFFFTQS